MTSNSIIRIIINSINSTINNIDYQYFKLQLLVQICVIYLSTPNLKTEIKKIIILLDYLKLIENLDFLYVYKNQ